MLLMLIKRILPFALTLTLGIFIASFFIILTMPQIKFGHRYEYRNECRWNKTADREERTRRAFQTAESQNLDDLVPPPPIPPEIRFNDFPVKPSVAPTMPRNHR